MRAVLLFSIITAISLAALARPRIGLYGYVWFALMRPDVLAWQYNAQPYSFALAVATLLGSLRYSSFFLDLFRIPFTRWILVLNAFIFASAVFAINPSLSWPSYGLYARMILMSLLIPVLIRTPRQCEILVLVMAGSLCFLGTKYGVFGLLAGGIRFSSGYGGFLSDNNSLALGFAMGAAQCWYARDLFNSFWMRALCAGSFAATAAAAVMTYSRGAALALVGLLLFIIYHSKQRLIALFVMAIAAFALADLLGSSYAERMSTLSNPNEEASARARMDYYYAALQIWSDYPVLGVGYGKENQQAIISRYRETDQVIHNTYLQMLTDSGTFATLIYLGLLVGTFAWLGMSTKNSSQKDAAVPRALQSSLLVFAIGGTFLSRTDFDLVYLIIAAAGSWWGVRRDTNASDQLASEANSLVTT